MTNEKVNMERIQRNKHTVGGNVQRCICTLENNLTFFYDVKSTPTSWSRISTLRYLFLKRNENIHLQNGLYTNVHSNFVNNRPKLEINQMSINTWRDKQSDLLKHGPLLRSTLLDMTRWPPRNGGVWELLMKETRFALSPSELRHKVTRSHRHLEFQPLEWRLSWWSKGFQGKWFRTSGMTSRSLLFTRSEWHLNHADVPCLSVSGHSTHRQCHRAINNTF